MNPEKFRFSEQQLQKLRGTHRRLRRLNRTVLMHLRQIWPHLGINNTAMLADCWD